MLGRREASVNTGVFRFLGENLEPKAFHHPSRPAPELGFEDVIGAIRLIWLYYITADWMRYHVASCNPVELCFLSMKRTSRLGICR